MTVTFLAPAGWAEGDSYTYNGTPITVTDLNGNPVTDGWKQGAVLTFQISGGVAYFVGGASGSFLPLSGGTMTGPAVGAPGGSTIPQFRNVYYGTEALTPGSSPLPEGTLYITPEMEYEGAGKRTCRFVVGTSTAGWTAADCDYLCDGTADDVEINAAIQALPSTGGEIVILDGTYIITATIAMNKDNVTLSGNGAATILQRNWDSTQTEGVIGITATNGNCVVKNIQIDGNSTAFSGAYLQGVVISNSSGNTIQNVVCNNNKNFGIGILTPSQQNKVIDSICTDNGSGIYCTGTENAFTGNICSNCTSYGIFINLNGRNSAVENICTNNSTGINSSSDNNTITGNSCYENTQYNIFAASTSNYTTITGNSCFSGQYGIYATTSNSIISGNNCSNNQDGIFVGGGNNAVIGNVALNITGNTIYASSSAANNLFVGNNIMGKNYYDGGTNNTWANNKFE